MRISDRAIVGFCFFSLTFAGAVMGTFVTKAFAQEQSYGAALMCYDMFTTLRLKDLYARGEHEAARALEKKVNKPECSRIDPAEKPAEVVPELNTCKNDP